MKTSKERFICYHALVFSNRWSFDKVLYLESGNKNHFQGFLLTRACWWSLTKQNCHSLTINCDWYRLPKMVVWWSPSLAYISRGDLFHSFDFGSCSTIISPLFVVTIFHCLLKKDVPFGFTYFFVLNLSSDYGLSCRT